MDYAINLTQWLQFLPFWMVLLGCSLISLSSHDSVVMQKCNPTFIFNLISLLLHYHKANAIDILYSHGSLLGLISSLPFSLSTRPRPKDEITKISNKMRPQSTIIHTLQSIVSQRNHINKYNCKKHTWINNILCNVFCNSINNVYMCFHNKDLNYNNNHYNNLSSIICKLALAKSCICKLRIYAQLINRDSLLCNFPSLIISIII